MATRNIEVVGTCQWAQLFEENRDMRGFEGNYESTDGAYTIQVFLDEDSERILQETGSIKRKSVKHGTYKFIRPHKHRFEWAGGAPEVVKADGTKWSFEEDGHIWNGSKVVVHLDVYDTKLSPGTRMTKVEVLELAEKPVFEDEKEGAPF